MILKRPSLRSAAPWIAFLGALAAYWLTVEPGASLWDCPEYIEGALRLEIGHPPGNPTWLLFHRIVSLFGITDSGAVLAINLAAGFFTAWAVGLLCACSQRALRSVIGNQEAVSVASILGALCFGWADSPWFSAVEAEVYAMSLWMTALCVWLSLKWLDETNGGRRWQYLILISYILGLSIGVHQLTLLVVPALAMIVCYGLLPPGRRAKGRQWIAAVLGAVIVGVVLFGLMKWLPRRLASFELLAVNLLRLPYNTGTLIGWGLILFIIGFFASLLSRLRRRRVSGILWCAFFLCVGFSSYALIIVRAAACPPMNQGNPSDIFSFITYIDRDQYGGAPLLYGSTPNSRPLKREHIKVSPAGDTVRSYYGFVRIPERPYYARAIGGGRISDREKMLGPEDIQTNDSMLSRGGDAYLKTGYKTRLKMIPELEMWFPRLHSSNPSDIASYEDWTGMNEETMVRVRITEAVDSAGNPVPMLDSDGNPLESTALRPSYLQNLAMLLGYQSGYMYFRYLLWNFAGRQNDVHSTGEVEHGNFISGLIPADNLMLGAEEKLPEEIGRNNPGRNRFFLIPLLFGLGGLVWLLSRGRRGLRIAGVSGVLFLMTGLAIVLYLNQTPGEPRERDYSFLGSFWVFGFWISAGMAALLSSCAEFSKLRPNRSVVGIAAYTLAFLVPVWMLIENYDDHDRSGRYPADEYAGIVLSSLPEGTILFTTGDNHTFPLWYARNARGVRRDVTIVNTSYLQLPWQAVSLRMPDETGHRVPMTMRPEDIAYGAFNYVRLGSDTVVVDAVEALNRLYSDTSDLPRLTSTRLRIGGPAPVVFDITREYGIAPGGLMNFRQLAMLDIIATNAASARPRPVAWHRVLSSKNYEGWGGFTSPAPFAVVWDPDSTNGRAAARDAVLKFHSPAHPGGRYIDPVSGGIISYQRMALMTEARRAIDDGDTLRARALLEFVAERYPFDEWSPQLKGFCGETIEEGLLYADLAESVSLNPELTDSLRRASAESHRQWSEYYRALPPRLRRALTPSSRRLAQP